MTDDQLDQDVEAAVTDALKNFDDIGEEASTRSKMTYEEQCVREIVRASGTNSDVARTVVGAVHEAGGWSMGIVHECYPHLPATLLSSEDSLRQVVRVTEVLRSGSKAMAVDLFYRARSLIEVCPQATACFMRTADWGNVVVHDLVWAGDETLRASIPRILVPSRGDPGDVLVVEARVTFVKFLTRIAFC